MPELPELETIRRSLASTLKGKTIAHIHVREPAMVWGDIAVCIKATISTVDRYGKTLILAMGSPSAPPHTLSFHLKLSGQLLYAHDDTTRFPRIIPRANSQFMPAKTTRVIIEFTDGRFLYFNDMRKFGWMKVNHSLPLNHAPDILSVRFTPSYVFEICQKTRRPVKVVLMDQALMAGIGNIYANDALWHAKIHPQTPANALSPDQISTLHHGIMTIINEGIRYQGSSAQDELYVLPDGTSGRYQNVFKVYHRTGKPCHACGSTIARMVVGARGTFFCPTCQAI